jgi:hypothetical protein
MQVATIPHDLRRKVSEFDSRSEHREQLAKVLTIREADANLSRCQRDFRGGHGEGVCKLTLVFSSNRPLGVRSIMLGGRNGYSAGSRIRK